MANDQTSISFAPFLGGFVIETLTIGMYGEARNAIREYIQNGFDSIQKAVEEGSLTNGAGHIEIEMADDHKSMVIRDNGAGLSVKNAATVLTRVGASQKSHRKNAGFRGIGRLAGIVFSNTVTFVTKAKGEAEQTTVIFGARAMRSAMSPSKGSAKSAEDLLKESVQAYRSPAKKGDLNRSFFEVRLDGFTDPPDECQSADELYDFVSQVAPVPYGDDFPYRDRIKEEARKAPVPIEEVRITIKDGGNKPKPVTKQYVDSFKFESGWVELTDCAFYQSPTKRWWAWVGQKSESGAYTDPRVRGLRVRVRNIQIDGTEIVREIFREEAKSYVRFQDYFLGEIFVDPTVVVPNARRDGFEEDAGWKRLKKELAVVVKVLGKQAYAVSTQGQHSVEALEANLKKSQAEARLLRRVNFEDVDRTIQLSKNLTTY